MKSSKFPSYLYEMLVFFLLLTMQLGCGRLTNVLSQKLLDCGSDAKNSEIYIKIFDPSGNQLSSNDLRVQDQNGTPLEATSRGCIAVNSLNSKSIIVASSKPDRVWGKIVKLDDLPWLGFVDMDEQSGNDLDIDCPGTIYSNGPIQPKLLVDPDLIDGFPYELSLSSPTLVPIALPSVSTHLAPTLPEGAYTLSLSYRNLFRQAASLTSKIKTCEVVLDRTAPIVEIDLKEGTPESLPRVSPGEKISIRQYDANSGEGRVCLSRLGDSELACEESGNFEKFSEMTTIQAPTSGKWCLQSRAVDLSGNESSKTVSCFLVFQRDVISNIRELLESSRFLMESDGLAGIAKTFRAQVEYFRLETEEEREEVRDSLRSAIIFGASKVDQTNRVFGTNIIGAYDGRFVVKTHSEIELRDQDGNFLDSIPGSKSVSLVDSIRGILIVEDGQELTTYRISDKLTEISTMDHSGSLVYKLALSGNGQTLFLVESKKVLVAQNSTDAGFAVSHEILFEDLVLDLRLSFDGKMAVLQRSDSTDVLELFESGKFQVIEGMQDERIRQFLMLQDSETKEDSILWTNSLNQLVTWTKSAGIKVHDLSISTLLPKDLIATALKSETMAYLLGSDSVTLIELRDGSVRVKSHGQFNSFNFLPFGIKVIEKRLFVYDSNFIFEITEGVLKNELDSSISSISKLTAIKVLDMKNRDALDFSITGQAGLLMSKDNLLFSRLNTASSAHFHVDQDIYSLRWSGESDILFVEGAVGKIWRSTYPVTSYRHEVGPRTKTTASGTRTKVQTADINKVVRSLDGSVTITLGNDGVAILFDEHSSKSAILDQWVGDPDSDVIVPLFDARISDDKKSILTFGSSSNALWQLQGERGWVLTKVVPLEITSSPTFDFQIHSMPRIWQGKEVVLIERKYGDRYQLDCVDWTGETCNVLPNLKRERASLRLSPNGDLLFVELDSYTSTYQLYAWDSGEYKFLQNLDEIYDVSVKKFLWNHESSAFTIFYSGNNLGVWKKQGDGKFAKTLTKKLDRDIDSSSLWEWAGTSVLVVYDREIMEIKENGQQGFRFTFLGEDKLSLLKYNPLTSRLAVLKGKTISVFELNKNILEIDTLCDTYKAYLNENVDLGDRHGGCDSK